jgi:taurine dioxygenase
MCRRSGSKRAPLTPQQRAAKPPVSHPVFLTHPITGRKVLYADPGYTVRINDMDAVESDEICPSCSPTSCNRGMKLPRFRGHPIS